MGVPPMRDHLLSFIDDAELGGPSAGFIERVLIAPIHPHLPKGNPGEFPQFPTDATPIHRPHEGGKIGVIRLLVKKLVEHLLRAFQPIRLAALPMNRCIRIVEPLNAGPGKDASFRPPMAHGGETQGDRGCSVMVLEAVT